MNHINITNYVNVVSAIEQDRKEEGTLKFPPKNSKRDKKRYKRNIKKQRRAYFRDAVENKTYYDTEFLDTIHKWYFK